MSPFSRFAHYFIAVARCGSLRRAAEQLHISASAINRQILQAEEAFGTPLFERLPEGLRMTTAGELLYDNLLRWQKEFRQTRQKFDELQGMKRGSVSVGMVQALAEGGFAAALAENAQAAGATASPSALATPTFALTPPTAPAASADTGIPFESTPGLTFAEQQAQGTLDFGFDIATA